MVVTVSSTEVDLSSNEVTLRPTNKRTVDEV